MRTGFFATVFDVFPHARDSSERVCRTTPATPAGERLSPARGNFWSDAKSTACPKSARLTSRGHLGKDHQVNELEQVLAEITASDDPDDAWSEALYMRGDVPDEVSEQWLKTAAELGVVSAMDGYADFLEEHDRIDEAESWYRAAAAHGSAPAMYACALIEDENENSEASEEFYRGAAERGFLPAIYDLGRILYQRGDPSWRLCASICQAARYTHWEELVGSGATRE